VPFELHPSATLRAMFEHRPYQGAAPEQARFLFVGLDANYARDIEDHPIFQRVVEYHQDGAAFWARHGVHHPFLLPGYAGGGRPYHRTFASIGFRPAHAAMVSFVELMAVPTVGSSNLEPGDLAVGHLEWLNAVIEHGACEHVFISSKVASLMRASRRFPWMPSRPRLGDGPLDYYYRTAGKTVHSHLHFSSYGKCSPQKAAQLQVMRQLVPTT
jgi:hypothetical protein